LFSWRSSAGRRNGVGVGVGVGDGVALSGVGAGVGIDLRGVDGVCVNVCVCGDAAILRTRSGGGGGGGDALGTVGVKTASLRWLLACLRLLRGRRFDGR
jgi:hypothetical protein